MARLFDTGIFSVNATDGSVGVGYKLNFYITGTSTRKDTYPTKADALAGTNANTNPVLSQADGRFPPIWMTGGDYKAVLTNAAGTVLGSPKDPTGSIPGADDIALDQTTVYPENSLGAKLTRTLSAKDGPFNAKGDGATADLTALNSWASHAGNGTELILPDGLYNISAGLSAIVADNVKISGSGIINYVGADTTPGALLTFGDGLAIYNRVDVRGIRVYSDTVLTGDYAVVLKSCRGVDLDILIGEEYGTYSIYHGLQLNGGSDVRLHSTGIYGLNTLFQLWNNSEIHCGHLFLKGKESAKAGYGIHIGGNVGGFYAEDLTQFWNDRGCQIDNTLTATGNLQIFLDGGTFDTNVTAGIYVKDGTSNPVGKIIHGPRWVGTVTSGSGVHLESWGDGKFAMGDGVITACNSSGIYSEDANTIIEVGSGATIYGNTGYGIDAATAITVRCLADLNNNNTLGAYSANVSIISDVFGQLKLEGTYTAPLRLGAYRLWVSSGGKLYIKSSAPSSDTDGTIVGTQT